MMAKPAISSCIDATSTLTLAARILAATRTGVQRQLRPYSIKSRERLAMLSASAKRANRKDSSECIMGARPNEPDFPAKPGSNQVPVRRCRHAHYDRYVNCKHRRVVSSFDEPIVWSE